MPEGLNVAAVIAAVVGLIVGILGFVNSRRDSKTNEKKAHTEAQNSSLTANLELTRYIDERVEEKVAPLRKRIEDLENLHARIRLAIQKAWRVVAFQWGDRPGPIFAPGDIDESIEDTLPPHWMPEGGGQKRS